MVLTRNLPLVITFALSLIEDYLCSYAVKYGRSGERHRGMRSDRRRNILTVLTILIKACDLKYSGIFCKITRFWSRPLTVAEIAYMARLSVKTVGRCIADLVDLGLVECEQIKKKNKVTGLLDVSIGIRRFTAKFWSTLGLADKFEEGCQWAKANARRKLFMPFKSISMKLKKTYSSAGNIAKSMLKGLSAKVQENDKSQSVRAHCEEILARIRSHK